MIYHKNGLTNINIIYGMKWFQAYTNAYTKSKFWHSPNGSKHIQMVPSIHKCIYKVRSIYKCIYKVQILAFSKWFQAYTNGSKHTQMHIQSLKHIQMVPSIHKCIYKVPSIYKCSKLHDYWMTHTTF